MPTSTTNGYRSSKSESKRPLITSSQAWRPGQSRLSGTPPNVFLAFYAGDSLGIEITFAGWMLVGVPLVLVFLPLAWLFLTRVLFAFDNVRIRGGRQLIDDQLAELGPMDRGESATLAVFVPVLV